MSDIDNHAFGNSGWSPRCSQNFDNYPPGPICWAFHHRTLQFQANRSLLQLRDATSKWIIIPHLVPPASMRSERIKTTGRSDDMCSPILCTAAVLSDNYGPASSRITAPGGPTASLGRYEHWNLLLRKGDACIGRQKSPLRIDGQKPRMLFCFRNLC